jgi:hypothetical protein
MNQVERLVLQMIGESVTSPDVFTDDSTGMAQIRDSINDAIEEIAIITGSYKESYFVALREARTFYRYDFHGGDVAWITDAWLSTQRQRLEQTDLHKLKNYNPRWLFDSGPARAYFPIGLNHFGVWPKPASDTDILELTAVIIPARYTKDSDRLKVRKDLEWAAAHYAIGEYYASRGDAKSAIEHHGQYLKSVGIDMPYIPGGGVLRLQSAKDPWPKITG